jgi:hypothetical protein
MDASELTQQLDAYPNHLENNDLGQRRLDSSPLLSADSPARTDAMPARAAIFRSGSKGFAALRFTAETGRSWLSGPSRRLCLFPA